MTGQQILESKRNDKNYEWETNVIKFKQWMKQQKTPKGKFYSDNAVNTAINTLRSFFEYYRTPLKFSQPENRKLNGKAKRTTQDYELTNNDIKKMADVGNLRERYIVLLGKSFGLRAGDFAALTYGTFRGGIDLNSEPPISIGKRQTEKEGVDAYPFIDSDALPIVKSILECNQNKLSNERIITIQEEELSTIIQNLAKKANIDIGDKHLRFHCFRKYLIDRLSANMSESKWKKIVGKTISEDAYVSPLELRECYIQTMKLTTINTNGNGKVTKEMSEKLAKTETTVDVIKQMLDEKTIELEKQNQLINKLINRLDKIEKTIPEQNDIELLHYIRKHPEEFERSKNEEKEILKWERENPDKMRQVEYREEDFDDKEWFENHREEIENENEGIRQSHIAYLNKHPKAVEEMAKHDEEMHKEFLEDQNTELKKANDDFRKQLKEIINKFQKNKETEQPTN
jgi:integrase/uncharacterized coiled-coil protein SlyX